MKGHEPAPTNVTPATARPPPKMSPGWGQQPVDGGAELGAERVQVCAGDRALCDPGIGTARIEEAQGERPAGSRGGQLGAQRQLGAAPARDALEAGGAAVARRRLAHRQQPALAERVVEEHGDGRAIVRRRGPAHLEERHAQRGSAGVGGAHGGEREGNGEGQHAGLRVEKHACIAHPERRIG